MSESGTYSKAKALPLLPDIGGAKPKPLTACEQVNVFKTELFMLPIPNILFCIVRKLQDFSKLYIIAFRLDVADKQHRLTNKLIYKVPERNRAGKNI